MDFSFHGQCYQFLLLLRRLGFASPVFFDLKVPPLLFQTNLFFSLFSFPFLQCSFLEDFSYVLCTPATARRRMSSPQCVWIFIYQLSPPPLPSPLDSPGRDHRPLSSKMPTFIVGSRKIRPVRRFEYNMLLFFPFLFFPDESQPPYASKSRADRQTP